MGITYDTAGNMTIGFAQCDCGLTGGCEKCRPFTIPKEIHEEKFLDPNLKEFYRKRGYLYRSEEANNE